MTDSTTTLSNSMLSSMVYEWKLMARQATITAVAIAALNCVNVKVLSFLRLPCNLFGIYRTCAIYEAPRTRQSNSKMGQIGANLVTCIILCILSVCMLSTKADMNDSQKDRFGIVLQAIMEFFSALNMLVISRGIYLIVDTFVYPDALNQFVNWDN